MRGPEVFESLHNDTGSNTFLSFYQSLTATWFCLYIRFGRHKIFDIYFSSY